MIRLVETSLIDDIQLNMSEVVHENYRVESGALMVFPFHCLIRNWDADKRKNWTQALNGLASSGGVVIQALFEDKTVGIASLSPRWFGEKRLQLYSLHIDRDFRRMGVGQFLLTAIEQRAKQLGANRLYISAAPKKGTVDFYLRMGARQTTEIDPVLYQQEPDDIHMEKALT